MILSDFINLHSFSKLEKKNPARNLNEQAKVAEKAVGKNLE